MTERTHSRKPVAVVTGASQGLGRALAEGLAHRGWALVVDARRPDRLDLPRSVARAPLGVADARRPTRLGEPFAYGREAASLRRHRTAGDPRPPLLHGTADASTTRPVCTITWASQAAVVAR